ncbi:MAG: acyl-CoA thioesterase [Candidatus Thermoplasmatota archaeon]|nr:acyl-CoA thioesterase [Candidatus Thermoplasmatota archaeon]MCL5731407.1 acyl-CoA thioesterase [Candidatus Thermoplasmatota archaeon]
MSSHSVHTLSLQLRYTDFDDQGVLNNAVYLTLFELARIEMFKTSLGERVNDYRFLIAHVEIDYLKPVVIGQSAFCRTQISALGNSSVKFYQEIMTDEDPEPACTGSTVAVLFDRYGKKNRFTSEMKELLGWKE